MFQHVEELRSSEGAKSFQTLHNKTPTYAQSIVKIIDLNAEQKKKFLSSQSILKAFVDNFEVNVKYAGKTFLNILENGIFKIPENVNNLKPKDYAGECFLQDISFKKILQHFSIIGPTVCLCPQE